MLRSIRGSRLNAPYGAPCFLTEITEIENDEPEFCLNAPYGAPCFLTFRTTDQAGNPSNVLMHLMALRAF